MRARISAIAIVSAAIVALLPGGCAPTDVDDTQPVVVEQGLEQEAPFAPDESGELSVPADEERGQFLGEAWTEDEGAPEQVDAIAQELDDKAATQQRHVLGEFFAGQHRFQTDTRTFGAPFGMHFVSSVWVGGQLWAYYITNDGGRLGIGLARSRDGIRFDNVGTVLRAGTTGQDNRMRSFPGVWYDGPGRWYLVFEMAGEMAGSNNPGSIGLATSADGVNWVADAQAILVKRDAWERKNVGTPSLWKEGGTWYLFYHGFGRSGSGGPDDCQVGVATGSDLRNLRRHSGNPIVRTSQSGPDSGTIGRRSIVREGAYYYMLTEISTDQPYERARWSTGLWRAQNLVGPWERCGRNPILPSTSSGFGYDGPEFIRTPDGNLHVYFRAPDGPTRRATLTLAAAPAALVFHAVRDLFHQGGRADGDGWSCNVRDDRACYMCYGPYTTAVQPGPRNATFRVLTDDNSVDNSLLVSLDIVDANSGRVLARRDIRRREFTRAMTYQDFDLPFTAQAVQRIETRVYTHDRAYLRVQKTTIR